MYSGLNSFQPIDLTPQGQVPGSTESPAAAVFFIVYMIVMALILAQLFTGFLIVTFQEDGVKTFRETKLNKNEVSDPGVYICIIIITCTVIYTYVPVVLKVKPYNNYYVVLI